MPLSLESDPFPGAYEDATHGPGQFRVIFSNVTHRSADRVPAECCFPLVRQQLSGRGVSSPEPLGRVRRRNDDGASLMQRGEFAGGGCGQDREAQQFLPAGDCQRSQSPAKNISGSFAGLMYHGCLARHLPTHS